MKMIRQRRVDSGQIGGVLSIFTQSMFIFGIVTFLNTTALVYQSILKYYISLWGFVIIIGIGLLLWMAIYYVVIMPSIIQFGNRQGYVHGNPMREDIEIIKNQLIEIKGELQHTKKNRPKLKHKIQKKEENIEEGRKYGGRENDNTNSNMCRESKWKRASNL